ncbi:uncharacterized protein LAJ45_08878 [Morchella importuna]|uniref:uncharacterized protein n=1 Tax=Morchella importuna TaxID=1174673 RepID=UPI001E8CF6C2|nr:uncharacterized protein LAJ45_08878 [Morchella importuna]KAH8147079.1 hypothetical protein LAJ45_08878 [Morchella importuna]
MPITPNTNNPHRRTIPRPPTPSPHGTSLPIQNDPTIYQQRDCGSIRFDTFNSESLLESEARMRRWQVRRKTLIWKVLRALRRAVSLRRMADRVLGDVVVEVGDTWGCERRGGTG